MIKGHIVNFYYLVNLIQPISFLDMFPEEFSQKLTEIKSSHNHELANLQRGYSVERREIEDAYKMEIAQLEDQHIQEKNKIIKELRKEQVSFGCFKWCMWLNYVGFKMQLLKNQRENQGQDCITIWTLYKFRLQIS